MLVFVVQKYKDLNTKPSIELYSNAGNGIFIKLTDLSTFLTQGRLAMA